MSINDIHEEIFPEDIETINDQEAEEAEEADAILEDTLNDDDAIQKYIIDRFEAGDVNKITEAKFKELKEEGENILSEYSNAAPNEVNSVRKSVSSFLKDIESILTLKNEMKNLATEISLLGENEKSEELLKADTISPEETLIKEYNKKEKMKEDIVAKYNEKDEVNIIVGEEPVTDGKVDQSLNAISELGMNVLSSFPINNLNNLNAEKTQELITLNENLLDVFSNETEDKLVNIRSYVRLILKNQANLLKVQLEILNQTENVETTGGQQALTAKKEMLKDLIAEYKTNYEIEPEAIDPSQN